MVYVGIVVVLCGLCWNFCGFVWRELSNHEPFLYVLSYWVLCSECLFFVSFVYFTKFL